VPTLLYLAYFAVTSSIIYAVGFITTALGALIMGLALLGFAAHTLVTSRGDDTRIDPEEPDPFRWHELAIAVLACLPALFVPSELTSPMASALFFLMFAVPTYLVAFGYHAWSWWRRRPEAVAAVLPSFPEPLAPPGWYRDPGDSGSLRWWDGWYWTAYVRPRAW